jgi:DMSO/TMAO reductase YedYZ molybdopterin-dependent catalytic subunit
MANGTTRREMLRGGLAVAGLGMLGLPEWALPALAQGEELVPFTDIPDSFTTSPAPMVRFLDIRTIENRITPASQFFTVQHYGHPEVDPTTFRLKITGLVNKPSSLSLADLRGMGATDLEVGFECSGNSPRPIQGLASNGRWTGIPLQKVLTQVGVKAEGQEVVFFGADHGEEEVEFRAQKFTVDQQFGRSLTRAQAMAAEPMLAWALNGEPLTRHQGSPLRLIVPGWYGVANVKWLAHIHVQEERFLGKWQARWYRSLKGETIDGQVIHKEAAITKMQLKSVIARVTRAGSAHKVTGFVLNDGSPIRSVDVQVDGGAWQPATVEAGQPKYAWKIFTYAWTGATPGEHTLVSRVTDATGRVQPTAADLESKLTFLEDNSQFPRKVMIAG